MFRSDAPTVSLCRVSLEQGFEAHHQGGSQFVVTARMQLFAPVVQGHGAPPQWLELRLAMNGAPPNAA